MIRKLNIKESNNIRKFTEADKGYSRSVYKVLDQAFKDDAGKAELVYISDAVDMWLFNTEKLYDEIWNNRRKATSIAYEALIDLFQDTVDGYDVKVRVTSEMVKQWFKKNGLSYIEALKPVVDKIEEERAERKAEKKESVRRRRYVKEEVFPYESKRDSSFPYMYVLTHGFGPGTIPRGVKVGRVEDYKGYTVVWLDRPLSTDELRQYDIPAETYLRRYLGNDIDYFRSLSGLPEGIQRKRSKRYVKEARSSRKTFTQKELKDMIRRGEAIDITNYSFEDADDLYDRGYTVIGVCRGVYGLNGALLQMNDTGDLCAITARNSTLMQLV